MWKKAGNVSFGSNVRCREVVIGGARCMVYCQADDIPAVDIAVSCVESEGGHNNVVDIFATVLRGVYAHLGMDIPSEFDPEIELEGLLQKIDGASKPEPDQLLEALINEPEPSGKKSIFGRGK